MRSGRSLYLQLAFLSLLALAATVSSSRADTVKGTCKATDTEGPCRELGGKACCNRCGSQGFGISPAHAVVKAGKSVTLSFTPHLPSPDAVIYTFGVVNWGDTVEALPEVGNDKTVTLTHTYKTKGDYTVRAAAGAQHKYQGDGSCSYQCCTETSATVTVN